TCAACCAPIACTSCSTATRCGRPRPPRRSWRRRRKRLNGRPSRADSPRMGKAFLLLVLLVGAIVGGGYWNYNRNAAMEADLHKPRPFANISTPDLVKLLAAYEDEAKRAKARVASTPGSDAAISRKGESDVEGKAEAFAQFQRQNEAWKAQRGNVMEHQ